LDPGKRLYIAAAHHRERTVLGARLAAGYGRVNEMQACAQGGGAEFPGNVRRRGGVVNQHRAGAHAGQGTLRARDHTAQIGIVANAAKHDVCVRCGLPGCGGLGVRPQPAGRGSEFL
jgi:hypothetical protein